MGYRIRVVPEVKVWLEALRDIDPGAADLVDRALDTLRQAGAGRGHRTRLAASLVCRDAAALPDPL
jgi:hypothetical protein